MSQKSYDNTPTLYIVPTPIGNLEDITLRALNILKEVEVIFSEDTRTSGILLKNFNIKKKQISLHKHNEEQNSNKILYYLEQAKSVALISDRGTPLISDPGKETVRKIIKNNFNVVSLPGATALIPALTNSGLDTEKFLFYGFLDNKQTKRKKELENIKNFEFTTIFYESPHRILSTLKDFLEVLGNRKISISREISKKHEEIYRGSIENISREIILPKGEFVLVIEGNKTQNKFENITIIEHVNLYIKEGYSEKDSFKLVAKERKISKSDIYKEYIRKR